MAVYEMLVPLRPRIPRDNTVGDLPDQLVELILKGRHYKVYKPSAVYVQN